MQKKFDFVVIGAGIIGLSIGNSLLQKYPKAHVLVADKEDFLGAHASGRNSGVLHAGFYYSPDSLKAKFCLNGNRALREVIARHSIEIRETGKVVVTKSLDELPRLEKLYERGIQNGVDIKLLPASELPNYEPLAITHGQFLWSPTTAVSNPQDVIKAMAKDFTKNGGNLELGSEVTIDSNEEVFLNLEKINCTEIINAAGVNAIHIAHKFGVGKEYSLLPVLGLYKTIPDDALPLKTLVYPVPNPANPFLGVHFTLTTDHKIKIGPTAIPVLGREQYKLSQGFDKKDLKQSISAVIALGRNSLPDLISLAITEFPKISTRNLLKGGSELVPLVSETSGWTIKEPGLRAQLVNKTTGEFEQDFIVRRKGKVTHILNAVSPGWTASIPFAEWVVTNNFKNY
jgi:L-2-hydroxyglutarate oxidase LhgO